MLAVHKEMSAVEQQGIPPSFITYAANLLGDTNNGLSGPKIVQHCGDFSVQFNVPIPHDSYPFEARNKRTALKENLTAFSAKQQYAVIKTLCELPEFKDSANVKDLKIKLVTRFGHLASESSSSEVNETLVEETRHWLQDYPESLKLYEDALGKFENGVFTRNLLDDLRLSLELLLRTLLGNEKSLENQIPILGDHLKDKGGSAELRNMFVKLVEYYGKYQNSYVKHDDAVIEQEIEFILEITSSFMKHVVRMA